VAASYYWKGVRQVCYDLTIGQLNTGLWPTSPKANDAVCMLAPMAVLHLKCNLNSALPAKAHAAASIDSTLHPHLNCCYCCHCPRRPTRAPFLTPCSLRHLLNTPSQRTGRAATQ
jgi:hypothetical protein